MAGLTDHGLWEWIWPPGSSWLHGCGFVFHWSSSLLWMSGWTFQLVAGGSEGFTEIKRRWADSGKGRNKGIIWKSKMWRTKDGNGNGEDERWENLGSFSGHVFLRRNCCGVGAFVSRPFESLNQNRLSRIISSPTHNNPFLFNMSPKSAFLWVFKMLRDCFVLRLFFKNLN